MSDTNLLAKKSATAHEVTLRRQQHMSRQIAREVVLQTFVEMNGSTTDKSAPTEIDDHHRRMIRVRGEIQGEPAVVYIYCLLNGEIRLSCFYGTVEVGCGHNFDLTITKQEIKAWLHTNLAGFVK